MIKALILTIALALAGCASTSPTIAVGSSPEAQIKTGADTVRAGAVTATELLKAHKITVLQARSYSTMLHSAGLVLNDAQADLLACRAISPAQPGAADPCWPKVSDIVTTALENIGVVMRAIHAK